VKGRKDYVLIGAETSERTYVGYEITQSHKKGNGLLGIYIHNMKDVNSRTDTRGTNPFSKWQIDKDGRKVLLSEILPHIRLGKRRRPEQHGQLDRGGSKEGWPLTCPSQAADAKVCLRIQ